MMRLLSTRKLNEGQRARLAESAIEVVEYDAIEIAYLSPPVINVVEALYVFTSRNAVRACFPDHRNRTVNLEACCVGGQTAAALRGLGIRVLEVAEDAAALAGIIIKKYTERNIIFYNGSLRRDVLPDLLRRANLSFREEVVYHTRLNYKYYDCQFDAVLFYSPSGVKSFTAVNKIGSATGFCIGKTTATALKKHTDKYIISKYSSVDAVIDAVLAHIKTDE